MRRFLHAMKQAGCPAPDPIFIVGLPTGGLNTFRTNPLVTLTGRRDHGIGQCHRSGAPPEWTASRARYPPLPWHPKQDIG